MDELTRYEKNHRDALCPIPRKAERSFNGDHILTAPVTAAETRELKTAFDRQIDCLSGKVEAVLDRLVLSSVSPSPPLSSSLLPSQESSPDPYIHANLPRCPSRNHLIHSLPIENANPPRASFPTSGSPSPVVDSNSSPTASSPVASIPLALFRNGQQRTAVKKAAPVPGVGIPDLPRGSEAWCAAIRQWEDPAATIGGKALKEWPEEWYTGPMRNHWREAEHSQGDCNGILPVGHMIPSLGP